LLYAKELSSITNQVVLPLVPDTEMGLLHRPTLSPTNEDAASISTEDSSPRTAEHKQHLHEVIGDALEVFSRHLRAHN
jgi:hypothetical protein